MDLQTVDRAELSMGDDMANVAIGIIVPFLIGVIGAYVTILVARHSSLNHARLMEIERKDARVNANLLLLRESKVNIMVLESTKSQNCPILLQTEGFRSVIEHEATERLPDIIATTFVLTLTYNAEVSRTAMTTNASHRTDSWIAIGDALTNELKRLVDHLTEAIHYDRLDDRRLAVEIRASDRRRSLFARTARKLNAYIGGE